MDLKQRWRLLVPEDTVVVPATRRSGAARRVRELPSATPVALVGRRGLRGVARRGRLRVQAEYIALPSLDTPVAITQCEPGALRYTARTMLTVPSGITRLHLPVWLAIRLVRAFPGLMAHSPAGDRLLVGVRR